MVLDSYSRIFRCCRLALFAGLVAVAAPVLGQTTTYTYQGNNYDFFPFAPAPSVFDGTMSVSGTFTRPLPLPPNLVLTSIDDVNLDFSMSNGVRVFTPMNSTVCTFEVSTGTNGQIVAWNILLREAGPIPANDPQATLLTQRVVSARDGGFVSISTGDDCDPNGLGSTDAAEVLNNPGSWTSDAMGVPALPEWAWVLLMALLAIAGATALRSRQRA